MNRLDAGTWAAILRPRPDVAGDGTYWDSSQRGRYRPEQFSWATTPTFKPDPETETVSGPDIRIPQVFVREGSYEPHELGLSLPGLLLIHVGFCGRRGMEEGIYGFEGTVIAHAHPEEICFQTGTYIFSRAGVVDDVLIHEYCHILAYTREPYDNGVDGHASPVWCDLMVSYGLTPTRYVTYVYR